MAFLEGIHVLRGSKGIMAFSLLSIGPVIFGSVEDLIAYLQNKQLLATTRSCPTCGSPMDLQRRSDIQDKYRYIKSNV